MSRIGGQPQPAVKQKPSNNVYTVLALVAFLSLSVAATDALINNTTSVAVGVVWWKNVDMTHHEQDPKRSWTNPAFLLKKNSPLNPSGN